MTETPPTPPQSLNHEFFATAARHAERTAFDGAAPGVPGTITHREVAARAEAFAAGLLALGVRKHDRVALVADNRVAWYVADRGILLAGAIDVPQPANLGERGLLQVLRHSGSRLAIIEPVDSRRLVQRWSAEGRLRRLTGLVRFGDDDQPTDGPLPEHGFEEVLATGRRRLEESPALVRETAAEAGPDSPATIVYTSGTTGEPKGVVLTHGNILHNIRTIPRVLDLRAGDRMLSILPAWHMFERTLEYVLLGCGVTIVYTSKRRMKHDLAAARPTIVAVVPRILEMIQQEVEKQVSAAGAGRRHLARAAFAVGVARARALRGLRGVSDRMVQRPSLLQRMLGAAAVAGLALPHALLDRLVCRRLRARLGPSIRVIVSGGGALPLHVDEFLNGIGFTTLIGYGLTETAPVVSVRRVHRNPLGLIGQPLPETEIAIRSEDGRSLGPDEIGVIHIRGPQVMRGYFRDGPRTRAVKSADGWFDSGDLGSLRRDGEIRITGRAKDTIVLRSGENVEPMPLESSILKSRYIEQVVVVGQDRKELAALVVPDEAAVGVFAAAAGLPGDDLDAWVLEQAVRQLIAREVRARTSRQEGFSPLEAVNRVHLLARPFSIDNGLLTHTMKIRRNVVMEQFAHEIGTL